ncbi:tetraacyldisaccharide 4'-kinase [Fulvivirga lutea]|uniref:Tetraacyldisaccharide 4'-kinase n=1 Tax=Fulvivirga lutea TaxID=2810512 RepID=A0A975A050_9BACT|nr:tetraacyldisaccharide 4'-kinase [Fulvivirga lutea]QSE96835.1 tetraacyldisaccharide 4'-kinase [Fulvivirga lutea]
MNILKWILFPFAILYDGVTRLRNYLFDIGYKKSFEFEANVIGVGNLTVGGTGKSPMVEYLVRLLGESYTIATLSRGYGRKTKGFRIANSNDNAKTLGDEPFQFFNKFKNIHVTVGEERAVAIPYILAELSPDVILMDDSYQHRYVKPSLNIMLTDYNRLFYNDHVLPLGRLREARKGAKRADIIVVTKCPQELSANERNSIREKIGNYSDSKVFFSAIKYLDPVPLNEDYNKLSENVLLFSGLAYSKPFTEYISSKYNLVDDIYFNDHHEYSSKDMNLVEERFRQIPFEDKSIVTTEKDIVKLLNGEIKSVADHLPIFYTPIEHCFIEDGEVFDKMVKESIMKTEN